jgi:lipopolysaccharide export system protein LptA
MLKDDKPVNVTGATLNYDGGNSLATYSGGSRLWQEDTTIQAPTIILDEKSGDLKAEGGVKSAFTLEQVDHKTNQPTKVPSLASGETLHYEDSARRARYMTNAHVNGPQGDCHAVMIDLFFAETGNTLERAEAERNVNLLADERTATGAHMTYWSADEKYLMHGEPVTIIEHAECRETTGKILTFWRSTDRIIVDGKDQLRTLTKSTDTKPSGAVPTPSSAVPTCSQTRRQ